MTPLSRREEQVLLAVWSLKENAYLTSIKRYLSAQTGTDWTLAAVQKPLLQLERKNFVTTYMGKATARRGGRRKKICLITKNGIDALRQLKKEQDVLWEEFLEAELASAR